MRLTGKTVLITGGAGFIGSHLVERCLQENMNVKVIDNLFTGKKDNLAKVMKEIDFIKADIRNEKAVENAVKGCDFILHEAARRAVRPSVKMPNEYNEVNINGTVNLLNSARNNAIEKIVFASSSSVYGNIKVPFSEEKQPIPQSPYSLTKLAGEHYFRIYNELFGLPTISLRYFNVFGPRQDFSSGYATVIPLFITRIMKGKNPIIFGNGLQKRDFTFISDTVEANICALKAKKQATGNVFNVCNGKPVSVNEIVAKINRLLGTKIKAKHEKEKLGDLMITHGSPKKAEKMLKFKCKVSFDEGLKKTIEYFKTELKC